MLNNSTFAMSGGSITGNSANGNGGGVFVHTSTFTMSGGSITGNNITSSTGNGESLYNNGGTAKYGGSWGTGDILVSGNMYTDLPLPYDDGSGGYKDPAPTN
ncbi:hypothetical protein FACS1894140_2640 [Spirochaetia bacterium]|nr:hypothetical protein FACS1894140_2640 [Spirochaetia bacterium]